jgi:hypothetical protein
MAIAVQVARCDYIQGILDVMCGESDGAQTEAILETFKPHESRHVRSSCSCAEARSRIAA